MIQREIIRDFYGKIIGKIETDTLTGDKVVRDFHGIIKGRYNKRLNVTKDFYGRTIARGDQCNMLLNPTNTTRK